MKEAIKKYFEEAITTDEALKNAYDEKKLDDCIKYINDQARSYLNGKNGAIEDTVVYKWARDFMYGDIEKPAEVKEETKTIEKVAEEIPETLSEEQVEPEEQPQIKETADLQPEETVLPLRVCKTCGYEHEKICQFSGAAIGDLNQPACKDYARRATDEEIEAIKNEPMKIEKVIEEKPVEPWKENLQKKAEETNTKKSKKSKKPEYDGPSLFDFDDLY